jgi:hypothetical protein
MSSIGNVAVRGISAASEMPPALAQTFPEAEDKAETQPNGTE